MYKVQEYRAQRAIVFCDYVKMTDNSHNNYIIKYVQNARIQGTNSHVICDYVKMTSNSHLFKIVL